MKIKFTLLFTGVIFLGLMVSSCKKCKDCSAEQTTYMDDSVFGTVSVSPTEVCGDELKTIESNPTTTVQQNSGGFNVKTVTKYDCQ